MPLLPLLILLIVVGVVVVLIPMDERIRTAIVALVLLFVALLLLRAFFPGAFSWRIG